MMPEDTRRHSGFKHNANTLQNSELLNEIWEIKCLLTRAYSNFNNSLEPELIEACVYEINSLQSRYAYLLRKIKEHGDIQVETFRFPKSDKATCTPEGDLK